MGFGAEVMCEQLAARCVQTHFPLVDDNNNNVDNENDVVWALVPKGLQCTRRESEAHVRRTLNLFVHVFFIQT